MHSILSGLSLTAIVAAIASIFSIVQFVLVRKRESREREFDKYHSLIESLVSPTKEGIFLDRQIAVVFELRHFNRYFECTRRILTGLKQTWGKDEKNLRVVQEIGLTLESLLSG